MAPAFFADSVSSIASAVELPPVPAMIGMRPRACWTPMRMSSLCSSKLTVGDSPVVPTTTMPSVPSATCQSMSARNRARSRLASSRIGVMIATRLPVIMVLSVSGRDSSASLLYSAILALVI